MSYSAMKWARRQPLPPSEKFVLFIMADCAREGGDVAFPSLKTLIADTGMSERTIQRARKALICRGLIEKEARYGQAGFRLRFDVILSADRVSSDQQPDTLRPPHDTVSDQADTLSPQNDTVTPPPNQQLTTTNHHTPYSPPISEKSAAKKPNSEKFTLPDWIPAEAWAGWLEMRRAKKCPTTPRAMSKAIKDLQALKAKGQDPGEVLDNCTLNGWRGIFPLKNTASQRALTPAEQGRQTSLDRLEALYVH